MLLKQEHGLEKSRGWNFAGDIAEQRYVFIYGTQLIYGTQPKVQFLDQCPRDVVKWLD